MRALSLAPFLPARCGEVYIQASVRGLGVAQLTWRSLRARLMHTSPHLRALFFVKLKLTIQLYSPQPGALSSELSRIRLYVYRVRPFTAICIDGVW